MNRTIKIALLSALAAFVALAQSPLSNTTLSGALTASTTQVCVASATNINAPSLGAASPTGSILLVEGEAMSVTSAGVSTTCFNVRRGMYGAGQIGGAAAHASGAKVWVLGRTVSTGDTSRPTTATAFLSNRGYNYAGIISASTPPLAGQVSAGTITDVAGKLWFSAMEVDFNTIATGACILNGSTVGTDKWIVALYDNTGALVANSATAGTLTANASAYQCIAFTSPVAVIGPGQYFLVLQGNGTTDTFKAYGAHGAPDSYPTGTVTGGTFGTVPATIAITTTFTASVGPMMSLY